MAETTYTQEQINDMRAIIAADDRKKAEAAQVRREAVAQRLSEVVNSSAYAEVQAALVEAIGDDMDEPLLAIHANALIQIMPRLAEQVAATIPAAPADVPTPADA